MVRPFDGLRTHHEFAGGGRELRKMGVCSGLCMARPLGLEFPHALYHVMSRGDRLEDIFDDDADRVRFLEILGAVVRNCHWL